MRVLIMRHGEAENGFSAGVADADRQLTDFGHRQAKRAGQSLREQGFVPGQIWVSPLLRAQQTAADVLVAYDSPGFITKDCLVPEGSTAAVIDVLASCNNNSLLLVSHLPLVANLVSVLSGLDVYSVPAMAPASMVLLQCDELLAGCCDILWHRHSPDFVACY